MDSYTSDPQTRKRKIECKPELVITSLQKFYSSHPEIKKVITYLNGDASLSLRIIDWFVTKYSRKNFVRYPLNGQEFLVYLSYKGQLKAYSKQFFDPNCRRERIMFKITDHDSFTTTIGKLNFFRWALESNILHYIEEHEEEIRNGYNAYLKDTIQAQKSAKSDTASSTDSTDSVMSELSTTSTVSSTSTNSNRITARRRRTKQSPSSLNKLQVYSTPVELQFD
jgi:hypothetical protein